MSKARARVSGGPWLRTVLWVVDAPPYCVPLVGFITGVTTVGHRRVGDMVAKTYVVGRRDAGEPVVVPGAVVAGVGDACSLRAAVGAGTFGTGSHRSSWSATRPRSPRSRCGTSAGRPGSCGTSRVECGCAGTPRGRRGSPSREARCDVLACRWSRSSLSVRRAGDGDDADPSTTVVVVVARRRPSTTRPQRAAACPSTRSPTTRTDGHRDGRRRRRR